MIDPLSVLVLTPYRDRIEMGYAMGMMSCAAAHLFGNVSVVKNVPVSLARNTLVNQHFLPRPMFEWAVFIDDDTGFSTQDFKILMDYPAHPPGGDLTQLDVPEVNPEGTSLNDKGQALIVTAEYARKVDDFQPVRFGMGFTRIHRSVFQILIDATEADGTPRIGQYYHQSGELHYHFFPEGPGFEGQWFGEDMGFYHLCRLVGITPRIEQRCQLLHFGSKAYRYMAPGVIG